MKVYEKLAQLTNAQRNCQSAPEAHYKIWEARHTEAASDLVKACMPSGAGFDAGTVLLFDECSDVRLVFQTSFHHMDENGCYDGWTGHRVTVSPRLFGEIFVKVSGENRNAIKEYISDAFYMALTQEVTQ